MSGTLFEGEKQTGGQYYYAREKGIKDGLSVIEEMITTDQLSAAQLAGIDPKSSPLVTATRKVVEQSTSDQQITMVEVAIRNPLCPEIQTRCIAEAGDRSKAMIIIAYQAPENLSREELVSAQYNYDPRSGLQQLTWFRTNLGNCSITFGEHGRDFNPPFDLTNPLITLRDGKLPSREQLVPFYLSELWLPNADDHLNELIEDLDLNRSELTQPRVVAIEKVSFALCLLPGIDAMLVAGRQFNSLTPPTRAVLHLGISANPVYINERCPIGHERLRGLVAELQSQAYPVFRNSRLV